jgi:hypothetical protein
MKQMRTAIRLIDEYGYTLPPEDAPQALMDAFRRRAPSGSGSNQTKGDL